MSGEGSKAVDGGNASFTLRFRRVQSRGLAGANEEMWNYIRRFVAVLRKPILSFQNCGTPRFEPALWSSEDDVQYNNNCYNYACNIRGTYAQPGMMSGQQYATITCEEIGRAAIADGLIPVDCAKSCGGSMHKVALVISPGNTFHWYRRDRNGRWSHKPGDGPPTNLDYSGHFITDPLTADRGPFRVFCGCYCVSKRLVSIK